MFVKMKLSVRQVRLSRMALGVAVAGPVTTTILATTIVFNRIHNLTRTVVPNKRTTFNRCRTR